MKRIIGFYQHDADSLGFERIRDLIMRDVDDCIEELITGKCKGIKIQSETICEGVLIV